MSETEHPDNDKRLDAINSFNVLDSGSEQVYDEITKLTADLCDAPICLVTIVEKDRQWFKSRVGIPMDETVIEQSVCAFAVAGELPFLEIEDTRLDDRTKDNPLCQGDKGIRFYAGALLKSLDGWPLGTLCVLDFKPRVLTDLQRRILKVHARSVTCQLELTKTLVEKARQAGSPEDNSKLIEQKKLREKTLAHYSSLTPREQEVMTLIAGHSGNLSSKQIARKLDISHRTVDHHRASILAKMKVESVAELIAITIKSKIFGNGAN